MQPSSQCKSNITRLAEMLSEYRSDNDGRFPNPEKWCDILLEQAKDESLFACPLAEGARCSYALNKHVVEAGADLSASMVLLFESEPGWNQVGGPELMITPHETRGGERGNVIFVGGRSRSVSEENVEELNWKPGQDTEDAEDEEDEEEESEDE